MRTLETRPIGHTIFHQKVITGNKDHRGEYHRRGRLYVYKPQVSILGLRPCPNNVEKFRIAPDLRHQPLTTRASMFPFILQGFVARSPKTHPDITFGKLCSSGSRQGLEIFAHGAPLPLGSRPGEEPGGDATYILRGWYAGGDERLRALRTLAHRQCVISWFLLNFHHQLSLKEGHTTRNRKPHVSRPACLEVMLTYWRGTYCSSKHEVVHLGGAKLRLWRLVH